MTDLQTRILDVMKAFGRNQSQFAKDLGVTQSSISQIANGKTSPSVDLLRSISKRYKVAYSWLIEGVGEMTYAQVILGSDDDWGAKESTGNIAQVMSRNAQVTDENGLLKAEHAGMLTTTGNVAMLDIRAAAGMLGDTDISGNIIGYFSIPHLRGQYYALTVDGDSMVPSFHDGDIVVVQQCTWEQFASDKVYVIDVPGSVPILKRVRRLLADMSLELYSDNPAIKAQVVEEKHIKALYRVRCVLVYSSVS